MDITKKLPKRILYLITLTIIGYLVSNRYEQYLNYCDKASFFCINKDIIYFIEIMLIILLGLVVFYLIFKKLNNKNDIQNKRYEYLLDEDNLEISEKEKSNEKKDVSKKRNKRFEHLLDEENL